MVYSHDRRIGTTRRSVAAGATGSATRSWPRCVSCCRSRPFADLSVSTISERAGVARSGFYFYFDSKYAVLAVILADAMEELDKLTHDFAPREADETPEAFATRMVGSAAAMFASNDPVMRACTLAQNTDAQIRELMNDFEDTVIDKIVGLIETGRRRFAGLRRPARAGADADARPRR